MAAKTRKFRKKKKVGNYPNATVIFSITMALFVFGLFSLLVAHADQLFDRLRNNMEIHIDLKDQISEEEKYYLYQVLEEQPYVLYEDQEPLISFTSKEDAAKAYFDQTGEDFNEVLEGYNPLPATFRVRIKAPYATDQRLSEISAELEQLTGVYEVSYRKNIIDKITQNLRQVSIVLAAFGLILLITSILLINNTIKLALFSQRFLIRSMQLVGATRGFIQKPFLKRAAIQGLSSGIIAAGLLLLTLKYSYNQLEELNQLSDRNVLLVILGGLVILGLIIGLYSSMQAINKYLKMSLDDLY